MWDPLFQKKIQFIGGTLELSMWLTDGSLDICFEQFRKAWFVYVT